MALVWTGRAAQWAQGAWRNASARLVDAVRFFRPEFWFVSALPAWIGWCLATREIVPGQSVFLATLRGQADLLDVGVWGIAHVRALLTLLVFGPLLGGALMVTNDYYDRQADVFNPKKARSPLVTGTATPARAKAWMTWLSVATVVVGFLVDPLLGLGLVLGIGLSFAYSAPPLRFKARPLGDVLVNALGYGGFTVLAGWYLGGGLSQPFPLGPLLVVVLAISAGYIPTVMMDRESDARAGLRTTAVAFGHRATWMLGLQTLIAANVTMAGLAVMGRYVEPTFLLLQLPFFVVELFAYMTLVRREDPELIFAGACLVTLALFGNLGAFLLVYTGVL